MMAAVQCGCRSKISRSIIDHLIRLETMVRRAFAHGEHVVSVFFDLKKPYDTVWKHGIMRDLYNLGLRGRLHLYIQQFLLDRSFKVQVNNILSDSFPQQGVRQGCVLSVTLFAIKINNIVSNVSNDNRYHYSLYVDDFQLSYRHHDLAIIGSKLQTCINNVTKWTN